MSMATCTDCGRFVDTDDEPEAYDLPNGKAGDHARCEQCRLDLLEDENE